MRHDDVKHYQQKGLAACEQTAADAAAIAACENKWKMDKTSEVCELVLYQSLSHKTMTTGSGANYDGFPGFYDRDRQNILNFRTQEQKINNDHDDDNVPNGHTAQLPPPGGGGDQYTLDNPINAVPKCARQPYSTPLPSRLSEQRLQCRPCARAVVMKTTRATFRATSWRRLASCSRP